MLEKKIVVLLLRSYLAYARAYEGWFFFYKCYDASGNEVYIEETMIYGGYSIGQYSPN